MTEAELRILAERWIALWRTPDRAAFETLHAEDFVDRASAGRDTGRDGFWAGIRELFEAFPDLDTRVADLVVEPAAGKVAVRWSATGTHRGGFLGREATGARITLAGIEIIRVVDGRIVERWGEWNGTEILAQIDGVS